MLLVRPIVKRVSAKGFWLRWNIGLFLDLWLGVWIRTMYTLVISARIGPWAGSDSTLGSVMAKECVCSHWVSGRRNCKRWKGRNLVYCGIMEKGGTPSWVDAWQHRTVLRWTCKTGDWRFNIIVRSAIRMLLSGCCCCCRRLLKTTKVAGVVLDSV